MGNKDQVKSVPVVVGGVFQGTAKSDDEILVAAKKAIEWKRNYMREYMRNRRAEEKRRAEESAILNHIPKSMIERDREILDKVLADNVDKVRDEEFWNRRGKS